MGLVRLSRNTQDMRLQPAVKRKPEDFSRRLARFYVNSALVNFSGIPHSGGVADRHVLQNLQLVDSYLGRDQQLLRDLMVDAETQRWVQARANKRLDPHPAFPTAYGSIRQFSAS